MSSWSTLNLQAAAFTSLTDSVDSVSGQATLIFSGLQVALSTVLAAAAGAEDYSITIYADTLTVDVPLVTSQGLVLVVRSLDLSPIGGAALGFATPAGQQGVAELLIGSSITSAPAIAQVPAWQGQAAQPIPLGLAPLQSLLFSVSSGAAASATVNAGAVFSQDLIGHPLALNSLQASYAAAVSLMDSTAASDRALAQAMFTWIIATIGVLGLDGATIPSDFSELYNQAGALLVTLNVAPGGFFVPVLSSTMYQGEIQGLISALENYESGLNTLAVETDIAAAIATVSSTLAATSGAEVAPLQLQLSNLQNNVSTLYQNIVALRSDFVLQAQQAGTDYQSLAAAVSLMELADFLQDSIDTVMSVASLGVDVAKGSEGDAAAAKDGVEALLKGVTSATAVINDLKMTPPGGASLVTQAKELMQMQLALMTSFEAATILWAQSQGGTSGDPLPPSLAVVAVDPGLAWDNYVISAQAVLATVKEDIGSHSSAAQDAANAYSASLQILAGYGKAINGKFAAYSSQMAQATVVQAQITAAQNVVARWQEQQAQATTEAQQFAILRGVLEARANALKRSIFVAWTYYQASYFYVNLVQPPNVITLDMNSAQLQDAFASVQTWVAQLLGTAQDGQHVVLPNTSVDISFDFLIRRPGDTTTPVPPGTDVALLTPATDECGATLTWSIPIGDAQLDGVLPNSGNVAIWITQIQFLIDGVTPNAKGNVLASVATSGTYQNGFGVANAYSFFSQPLIGEYGYHQATGKAYIPWQIPTAVYMTPTPYTQWTLVFDKEGGNPTTATRLSMALTAAYVAPSS